MRSSDRTAFPPLAVTSCLKDQSGKLIHPRQTGREDFSPLWCSWAQCWKKFFICILTDIASKCCWHLWQSVFPPCCILPYAFLFYKIFPLLFFLLTCTFVDIIFGVVLYHLFFVPLLYSLLATFCLASFCLCFTAGVFQKNNKVWGCACACVLHWLHRLDALAALGWLLVWSPGKLYDLFS